MAEVPRSYRIGWYAKYLLYRAFGVRLPKLRDQQGYWEKRGQVYMDEIRGSGYLDREVFFQNMLVSKLRDLDFASFFEAGCGFGWNIRRIKEEFPQARVGGVDFSTTQLANARDYVAPLDITLTQGDACAIPLPDNTYDVGFSLGVFMNIHPDRIALAAREMMRVCGKYIIHLEYDERHTTPALRERRAFKTNIVSHDYRRIYESLGGTVREFTTHLDFGDAYRRHVAGIRSDLTSWEGFEGPEKYIWIVVAV